MTRTRVPCRRSFGTVSRPPSAGNLTVVPAVSISADTPTAMISFSPRLNRPRLFASARFRVSAISVQACDTSANPGPSSSTVTTVVPSASGLIVTLHRVATGASSQAFWISSLTSVQGSRAACSLAQPAC